MRKIKNFLLILMLAFITPVLWGCNDDAIRVAGVSFEQGTYTVVQGDTVQLSSNITPIEATNKIVDYQIVSGNQYITISKTGLVTAKTSLGSVKVTAQVKVITDDGKWEASCGVDILPNAVSLDSPSGLVYKPNLSIIEWDKVERTENNFTASYTLSITKDGGEPTIISNTRLRSHSVLQSGTYVVKVKAVGDNAVFTDSEFSSDYTFTILPTLSKPTVNNGIISLDKVSVNGYGDSKDHYQLVVTNTNTSALVTESFTSSETDQKVSWAIPAMTSNILTAGTYQYKVRLLGDSAGVGSDTEYFTSKYSSTEGATFIQLGEVANLIIANDKATWDIVPNALSYSIYVYTTDEDNPAYTYDSIGTNSWTLPTEISSLDTYTIKVRAIGNGATIISGQMSELASQKLANPQNLSINNLTISWDEVLNATNYLVYINNASTPISSNSALSYTFQNSDFNIGANNIRVVASVVESASIYADSDESSLSVTKLATPTLSAQGGNIGWSGVLGVDENFLSITPAGMTEQTFTLSDSTLSYALGDSFTDGAYSVKIQAKGNQTDVLDSDISEKVDFVKMSAPEIVSVTENGNLTWKQGNYSSSSNTFSIIIRDASGVEVDKEIRTSGLSYNVGQYLSGSGAGKFYFIIKAVNNLSSQLYLNSKESESVTTYKLSSPTNLKVAGGRLEWTGISANLEGLDISSKFDYKVKIGSNESQTTNNTFLIPSANICYPGKHNVQVQARLSDASNKVEIDGATVFLIGSDYSSSLNFTKLSSVSTPTISDEIISGTGIEEYDSYNLVIETPSGMKTNYSVTTISNAWSVPVSNLFGPIDNVVKGTYKISVVVQGGVNAVSSDQSGSLNVFKLESPTISVNNGEIKWNTVSSNLDGLKHTIKSYTVEIRKAGTDSWTLYLPASGETFWNMNGYEEGEYEVRVTANSPSNRILASKASNSMPIEKLGGANVDTLQIDSSDVEYNKVSWEAVPNANYKVSIYQIFPTGAVLMSSTVVETNEFKISNEYKEKDYLISIQSVFTGKVSGDVSMSFKITRLQQVQGVSVAQNGDISWDAVEGAEKYLMYIRSESSPTATLVYDTQVDSVSRNAKLLSGGNPILTSEDVGTFSIQIMAVKEGVTTPVDGILVVGGAPSVEYSVIRYRAPTLSVTAGQLVWNSPNSTNFGYELTFNNGGLCEKENIGRGVNTYNMVNQAAETEYALSIVAKGNGGIYLDSPTSSLNNAVTKLKEPTYRVANGILQWDKDINAQSYTVITRGSDKTITTTGLQPTSTQPNIVALSPSSVQGMSGTVAFTIQAIGSGSVVGENPVYISSIVATTNEISKHATPTGLGVQNGEITWTRAASKDYTVGSVTYTVLDGYNIKYGANNKKIGTEDLNEEFILSQYITVATTLHIEVCALGNSGDKNSPVGTVYLNSDYTKNMNVVINGRPENLDITDGVLTWTENAQDSGTYSDYEILIIKEGGEQESVRSQVNRNSLDGLSGTFTSITVRHKGSVSSFGSETKYVNSARTEPLNNVKKLGPVSSEVNTDGEFEWNAEDFVFTSFTAGITFTVNNVADSTTGIKSINKTFLLNGEYGGILGENQELEIVGYATGSTSSSETDANGYCYLNSVNFNLNAYRFAPVLSFNIEQGLKFVWTVDNYVIGDMKNNRFIIEYKLGEDASDEDAEWQTKIVDNLNEFPLWTLGYYKARISVSSSNANIIKSVAYHCSETSEAPFLFNKFEGGEGSYVNPFIISTTTETDKVEASSAETKFGYIYVIPSAYFKLVEDITLTEKGSTPVDDIEPSPDDDNIHTTYYTNLHYITNIDGERLNNIDTILTGGVNGGGYTIYNYQVYNARYTALWRMIEGKSIEGWTGARDSTNFYGRSGIVYGLNLEVASFDANIDADARYVISFFTQRLTGGWILDCDLSMETPINLTNIECEQEIIYAGFAGYMFAADTEAMEDSDKTLLDARIMNCSSNISISLTKKSGFLQAYTLLSGIVGYNYGGTLYNCVNTGSLGGTQVAGIALYSDSVEYYREINMEYVKEEKRSVISGCENSGDLTAYPIGSEGNQHPSNSGGIVGQLNNGNMIFCKNSGLLTAVSGNYFADNSDFAVVKVVMGGLIGELYNGNIINCLSVATITVGEYISKEITGGGNSQIGGLIGNNSGTVSACYFDSTLSILTDFGGVIGQNNGKTTAVIQSEEFIAANFLVIDEDEDYYDSAFGKKPIFTYTEGNYPTLSWIALMD